MKCTRCSKGKLDDQYKTCYECRHRERVNTENRKPGGRICPSCKKRKNYLSFQQGDITFHSCNMCRLRIKNYVKKEKAVKNGTHKEREQIRVRARQQVLVAHKYELRALIEAEYKKRGWTYHPKGL